MLYKVSRLFAVFLAVILLSALSACASPGEENITLVDNLTPTYTPAPPARANAVSLTVFAAASLNAAFKEIGNAFEAAHPGVTMVYNFAGSQQLAQQINQGAPADVFASANQLQMTNAVSGGRILSETQQIFVMNRLVVITPTRNPASINNLQDLAKPGLKLVLADKSVPAGQYASDFLDLAAKDPSFGVNFKARVLNNVVSYENDVKAVLTKVELGEGDAGIVYTTDAAGAGPEKVGQLVIPDALNVIAAYPIAPVKDSPHEELAREFISYVLSADGQKTLAKFGFIPVKK